MPKSFSLEELLRLNPHIDQEEFNKMAEILARIKAGQIRIDNLNKPPTSRYRRISIGELNEIDSRTVRLGRKVQR